MSDIDTSANAFNPRPTHDELLTIRDRMLARLESGAPVRLIHSATLRTEDLAFALRKRERYHREHQQGRQTQVRRAFGALNTARRLGAEYAGVVTDVEASW